MQIPVAWFRFHDRLPPYGMVLYRGKTITPQIQGFLEELAAVLDDDLPQRLHSNK